MITKNKWIKLICIIAVVLVIAGIAFLIVSTFINWGYARDVSPEEAELRQKYIEAAELWLNANQRDGSHKEIINIYNGHTPLAQGYTVKYTDKWCAAFVSTVAIQCGLTDIIPTECGCQRQIGLFDNLGRWEENDDYVPLPGDIIYYSAEGASSGDNTGWSDHVGIVCGTLGSWIKVIEGNVAGTVAYRYIVIGDSSIRGYGLPDYALACE